MERRAYSLIPRSGLHLGREGLAQETASEVFPSDSMFSALVAVQAQRDSSLLGTLLAGLPLEKDPSGETSLRLSSCFPLVNGVLFFPRPKMSINASVDGKLLRKIRYISWGILQALLNNEDMTAYFDRADRRNRDGEKDQGEEKGRFIQGKIFWLRADEQKKLPDAWGQLSADDLAEQVVYHSEGVTRVNIDRATNYSTVYQVARTTFAPHCGLWLMVEAEAAHQDHVQMLLEELQETGIGAERSSGYGSFILSPLTLLPELARTSDHAGHGLLLSRYNPTLSELRAGVLGDNASYDLVDVGGWMYSAGYPGQLRQRVRMIEAGSVLDTSSGQQITGRVLDVRPPQFSHAVYRSGIALTL
jgi:CRISPR-associated protein Csm4